ncbi:uridine kinase family-domain-containing protein [Protomyces lactucae-debilis]|uniref:Uridine kinase n=1 Tax=Protomyces lactucae-debilis TaxID=2754530 RepID=A0A1Y2FDJ5_PROLT|nr:uridine kinase family-domain-containing protein [Protomyces lactucae-debilis]ORY81386.1 uridine kinase family-domain-containing protein [Protomyces lactucae-debilis]
MPSYRPPWLAQWIIGVAGASGSGKTTFAREVVASLGVPWVVIVSLDSFYKVLTPEQSAEAHKDNYQFDHPQAFDWDLLIQTLEDLKAGKRVEIPVYSFAKHARLPDASVPLYGVNVVVLEGIYALHDDPRLQALLDMKIYLDTDSDVCLARRLARDTRERGRDLKGILAQYSKWVKPAFDATVRPQMHRADVIIPRGCDNKVALKMVVRHIEHALAKKSEQHQQHLAQLRQTCSQDGQTEADNLPSTVSVLEQTNQVRGIHTIIRNGKTERDDFIFYLERMATLIVERSLEGLPHTEKHVTTACGQYRGAQLSVPITGVSIMRAGEIFEVALRQAIRDCQIGKLLIQSDSRTGEPRLHYLKLPKGIASHQILLLDAQIASAATAIMAVRVLLDHGVPEEQITFVAILASALGVRALASVYPKLKVVVGAVDEGLMGVSNHIKPGAGNLGQRYFGA